MKDKTNIIIGLLVLIIVLLVGTFVTVFAPININRTYKSTTTLIAKDAVLVTINWSVRYKAPLIFPKKIRLDAEDKIKRYGNGGMHALLSFNTAASLSKKSLDEIQEEFNMMDEMIRTILRLLDDKIDNVEPIKLNSIEYIKDREKVEKKLNRDREIADSLGNRIMAQI